MERHAPDGTPRSGNDTPTSPSQAKALDALRADAVRMLARIAEDDGAGSRLYRLCSEIWCQRDEDARLSLSHGDAANARVILERALHLLTFAPRVLARNELAFADLEMLLRAA